MVESRGAWCGAQVEKVGREAPRYCAAATLHPWRVWKAQVDAVDSYDHVAQGAAGEATKDAHSSRERTADQWTLRWAV